MKGKYLITTDNWFFAPDGKQYRAVWGEVEICTDEILGVKTNRMATNWFAKVGSEENHLIVAGCQIHYSCKCENKPDAKLIQEYSEAKGDFERPTYIYIAE